MQTRASSLILVLLSFIGLYGLYYHWFVLPPEKMEATATIAATICIRDALRQAGWDVGAGEFDIDASKRVIYMTAFMTIHQTTNDTKAVEPASARLAAFEKSFRTKPLRRRLTHISPARTEM